MLVLSVHFTKRFDLEDTPLNEPLFTMLTDANIQWAFASKSGEKIPSD